MEDHDQRFKTLVQTFVVEFLTLFFPDLVCRLDLSGLSWLDKEIFPDPPSGARYSADLIARIPVIAAESEIRPNEPREQVLLLHIEIESADTVAPFRKRMFDYWTDLSRKLDLDILPLAVYLRVGLQGRGKDTYERRIWDRMPLRFEYDYVGLPALSGEEYLHSGNNLGVALSALMDWPREQRVQAALEAIRLFATSSENGWKKLLLADCVQAYAPLEDSQRIELNTLLDEPQRGLRTMIKTWTEQAEERALLRMRNLLFQLALKRFGVLPEAVQQKLATLSMDQVEAMIKGLFEGKSLQELGLEEQTNGTRP